MTTAVTVVGPLTDARESRNSQDSRSHPRLTHKPDTSVSVGRIRISHRPGLSTHSVRKLAQAKRSGCRVLSSHLPAVLNTNPPGALAAVLATHRPPGGREQLARKQFDKPSVKALHPESVQLAIAVADNVSREAVIERSASAPLTPAMLASKGGLPVVL